MRRSFLTAASLLVIGFSTAVSAAPAEDAAYDKNNGPVIDSRGNCVRTMWMDKSDPCAAPAAVKKPVPAPRRVAAAPAPVVSREARTLYFDFNKATLTPDSITKLDALAETINGSTAINDVTIHGFTDQIGTASYNDALANKRVAVAKAYLDSKSRLKAEGDVRGLGKSAPEAECTGIKKRAAKIACMAKERRVEIEFNAQK